jgi:hypothetical protein
MPTDFNNKELVVDDIVVIVQPRYKNFVQGKIIKITQSQSLIEYTVNEEVFSVRKSFNDIIKKEYKEHYLNQDLRR